MADHYRLQQVEQPDAPIWQAIGGGIHDYNIDHAGPDNGQPLCFVLYGPDETIAGGIIGETHWDWLYISLLIVDESLRGQGYGHRLLMLAEDAARRRGAKAAYLDTFSFQAPQFYKDHGYEVFGELVDFPTGHRRYYLWKQL